MKSFMHALLCGVVVAVLSASAQADLIGQHVGVADPVNEGFAHQFNWDYDGAVEDGVARLRIQTGYCRFNQALTTGQIASLESTPWEANATIWVANPNMNPTSGNSKESVYLEVSYGSGTDAKTYAICPGTGADGSPRLGAMTNLETDTLVGIMYNDVPTALYHTYTMKRESTTSTDVNVYVDGVFQTTIAPCTGAATETLNRFVWGACAGTATGSDAEARWASVSLTTVPEPSTLILILVGAFGLLAYAWRKRK